MTEITKENLLKDGWQETKDPIFLMKKKLQDTIPEGDENDDNALAFVVHRIYNVLTLALALPDGALLNLNVKSIEELQQFDVMIVSYDPPY